MFKIVSSINKFILHNIHYIALASILLFVSLWFYGLQHDFYNWSKIHQIIFLLLTSSCILILLGISPAPSNFIICFLTIFFIFPVRDFLGNTANWLFFQSPIKHYFDS